MSDYFAIYIGDDHLAPNSNKGSAFDLVLLKILTLYPALRRCLHMLNPITPVPIQPICKESFYINLTIYKKCDINLSDNKKNILFIS